MCLFHVLCLNIMPFSMPSKLQKRIVPFLLLPDFGRIKRPQTPISQPLNPKTPPLYPCSDARNPVSHTPKHHLGCPILPFGVSHFTIWGIFSAHLRTMYSSILVCLLRFRCKSLCVSFLSVHHVFHDSFGWINQFL